LVLEQIDKVTMPVRVVRKDPHIPWPRVWKNVYKERLRDPVKSLWYAAIHDILPTNERLAAIKLKTLTTCSTCGNNYTFLHRITRCEEGPVIWNWTRELIAKIMRTDSRSIPEDWILQPTYHFNSPFKQSAFVWLLAHLVHYRLQSHRRLTLDDYIDFLRRARWKEAQWTPRSPFVQENLEVIWTIPAPHVYVTSSTGHRQDAHSNKMLEWSIGYVNSRINNCKSLRQ
jgi:hypothetical protein